MPGIAIQWQNKKGTWAPFEVTDVLHMSVSHSCYLFLDGRLPVVAREGEVFIVNTPALEKKYRKNGKKVTTFSTILQDTARLDFPLGDVGFLEPL
ncbi:hypothetical protein [Oryzomonas rubra]|uniref:Uncharacterized protein n=1 Tax=Oryzomonas rubra TaxID=2509454 RepID=A0A5A9X6Y9_9BACT|nr:hypothetical protein [Oryzomonas rubra]KAA0888806.1 hypothetical protein ET418_15615 [Oryzomonas rubra]